MFLTTSRWRIHQLHSPVRVLLATFIVVQLLGILAGPVRSGGRERIPQWSRLPGSAILVACAAVLCLATPGALHSCRASVCAGMLCGHLGDLAMGRLLPTPEPWMAGMVLFGIGHAFYLAAFRRLAQVRAPGRRLRWHSPVAAMVLISLAATAAMLPGTAAPVPLRVGGLGYAVIIAVMTGLALALARADARLRLLALGALLFWLSDVMLGASLFRSVGGSLWNDTIWVAYIAGQALIVTGPR